jgi:hypothetical protein
MASLGLAASALLLLPGCGGGSGASRPGGGPVPNNPVDPRADAARREREAQKPDFELGRLLTQPNGLERLEIRAKPGHWTSATLETTANKFHFKGNLTTDPVPLDNVAFEQGTSRPVTLAKGQKKYLELLFFSPVDNRARRIGTRLSDPTGREMIGTESPVSRMELHEFYFVVLAKEPDAYAFLKSMPCMRMLSNDISAEGSRDVFYRVISPKVTSRTPLPTGVLTWTTIAVVLWDDLEPSALSPEQQQALIDWLHWGGQLVVSGPGSLATFRGSYLETYLPRSASSQFEMNQGMLGPMSKEWSVPEKPLLIVKPWTGEKFETLSPEWSVLESTSDGSPLLVERRVGRGRIVVSAFRLNQLDLLTWSGMDEFTNARLLHRPGRRFSGQAQEGWQVQSKLRFFARDTGSRVVYSRSDEQDSAIFGMSSLFGGMGVSEKGPAVNVAGWDDESRISQQVREELKEAASIVIPDTSFVVKILAVYLAVIVPLNWGLFRLIGKVEWAWAAAPVVSIGFAVAVVRLAQLDIGFARSQTELGVVELQPGYSRAHVSRFTALYSSLSTRYDLVFDEPSALALPYHSGAGVAAFQANEEVNLRRTDKAVLSGFQVTSSSTGMVRSEHMLDVGGTITLANPPDQSWRVKNGSSLPIVEAAVFRRIDTPGTPGTPEAPATPGAAGQGPISPLEMAWVGDLGPGEEKTLQWQVLDKRIWRQRRNSRAETSESPPVGTLGVSKVIRIADLEVEQDEVRLVGLIPERLPGLSISPPASQATHLSVLVAHLTPPALSPVTRDLNRPPDYPSDFLTSPYDEPPIDGTNPTDLPEMNPLNP